MILARDVIRARGKVALSHGRGRSESHVLERAEGIACMVGERSVGL
jgi:hypothetical protein